MKIRLDKFLSSQLNISRNDAKKMLRSHCVKVNGAVILKADYQIETESDIVCCSGRRISFSEHVYIMLNKPKGVVSSTDDNRDITVIDILPDDMKRSGLFPAGRLDKNTTGFVLITDDGEFAHDILSPSHHVMKTYIVEVPEALSDDDIDRFLEGMKTAKDTFKPAQLRYLGKNETSLNHEYEIKISEGKYHQIKRMFAAVGNKVIELRRIAIGDVYIDDTLEAGQARYLSDEEAKKIKIVNKS